MRALIGALARAAFLAACLSVVAPAAQVRTSDKTCVLDGASVMAFGVYDPSDDAPLDVQGRVSYRCGNHIEGAASRIPRGLSTGSSRDKLIVQISLSPGNAGTFQRYMRGGRDRLRYNLYLDSQRTIVWGDGTSGSQVYSEHAQPNNQVVVVPVFGRVFPAQDVGADYYLDSLIVTLDF